MSGARSALFWVNMLKGMGHSFSTLALGHPRGIANSAFVADQLNY
jgi:hypothetical protein